MKLPPILSITGSDSTGGAGVQADIRTVTALGGHALTAITAITIQDAGGIMRIHNLPADVVMAQVMSTMVDVRPKAIKIGMVRDATTIEYLSREIAGSSNIVLAPGMFSSNGVRLMSDEAVEAWKRYLIPMATLLQLRCSEAEVFLGMDIRTDEDMIEAARRFCHMGAKHVLLRGGHQTKGMVTALLYDNETLRYETFHYETLRYENPNDNYNPNDNHSLNDNFNARFFSSHNTEGWQKHGVGGALSTAIATCLAMDGNIDEAIKRAHAYMHSQVVYSVSSGVINMRPADIYNQLMSLIADNYKTAHDVAFYADRLSITTRYLSQVTGKVVGKTPKQLISEYLIKEATILLRTTRLSIQEISDKLGFSSQVIMCKFFNQQVGCSPSEWRTRRE